MNRRAIGVGALKTLGILTILFGCLMAYASRFIATPPRFLPTLVSLIIFAFAPTALGLLLILEGEAIEKAPRGYTRLYKAAVLLGCLFCLMALSSLYHVPGSALHICLTIGLAAWGAALLYARVHRGWSLRKARRPMNLYELFGFAFRGVSYVVVGVIFAVVTGGRWVPFRALGGGGGKSGGGGASGKW